MKSAFPIISLFILLSCFDKGDCLITSTNLAKVYLQKSTDGTPNSTKFSLIAATVDQDTLVISTDTTSDVTSIILPLNPDTTATSFLLRTTNSREFHFTLGYSSHTQVISSDCGAYLYYDHLAVKDSNFDSTKMINPQLLISVQKNVEVFY